MFKSMFNQVDQRVFLWGVRNWQNIQIDCDNYWDRQVPGFSSWQVVAGAAMSQVQTLQTWAWNPLNHGKVKPGGFNLPIGPISTSGPCRGWTTCKIRWRTVEPRAPGLHGGTDSGIIVAPEIVVWLVLCLSLRVSWPNFQFSLPQEAGFCRVPRLVFASVDSEAMRWFPFLFLSLQQLFNVGCGGWWDLAQWLERYLGDGQECWNLEDSEQMSWRKWFRFGSIHRHF